ncbi:MAG TPA: PCRF domain-containing protein, partial [Desulfopila sp.]|nr:PCRF domain-containing protein [Desulfopila sp.]
MFTKFEDLEEKISDLEGRLSDPSLMDDQHEYQIVVREHSQLTRLNELYNRFRKIEENITDNQSIIHDPKEDCELKDMAREENEELLSEKKNLESQIRIFLLPKDPNDEKNTFLEIRAGTGGDEAALFVGDLFRMYSRYAENEGWRV